MTDIKGFLTNSYGWTISLKVHYFLSDNKMIFFHMT
jgi:hypothetical protein